MFYQIDIATGEVLGAATAQIDYVATANAQAIARTDYAQQHPEPMLDLGAAHGIALAAFDKVYKAPKDLSEDDARAHRSAAWEQSWSDEERRLQTLHLAELASWNAQAREYAVAHSKPVYCTLPADVVEVDVELSKVAGKAWVWDGAKTVQVDDFRGVTYEKSTGNPVTMMSLGPLPDALTKTRPPNDTSKWDDQTAKWVTDPAKVQAKQVAQAQALQAALGASIQQLLDRTAQARGYDHMLSLCSYAASTNARFHAEALAGMAWRDAVWAKAGEVLAQVQAGTRAVPTEAELLGLLPQISWPA